MRRSELVLKLSQNNKSISNKKAEQVVDALLERLSLQIASGERIELRGFGSFHLRHTNARQGRNPKTGQPIDIKSKHFPHFRPGLELKNRVNKEK